MAYRKSRDSIKITNNQDMHTARETLRALGFNIYHAFEYAVDMASYDSVHVDKNDDGYIEVARGTFSGSTVTKRHDNLQSFLNEHFKLPVVKTPSQLELEKLEASAAELNTRIAALKSTIV